MQNWGERFGLSVEQVHTLEELRDKKQEFRNSYAASSRYPAEFQRVEQLTQRLNILREKIESDSQLKHVAETLHL